MILAIEPTDPTPVYEQIRSQVAHMIAAGTLTAGTRLPPIRQLANDLGLAKGTVAKAYETLTHDGLVESAGRHGTRVATRAKPDPQTRDVQLDEAARIYAVRTRQLDVDTDTAISTFLKAVDRLP